MERPRLTICQADQQTSALLGVIGNCRHVTAQSMQRECTSLRVCLSNGRRAGSLWCSLASGDLREDPEEVDRDMAPVLFLRNSNMYRGHVGMLGSHRLVRSTIWRYKIVSAPSREPESSQDRLVFTRTKCLNQ